MFPGSSYVISAQLTALGTAQTVAVVVPFSGIVTYVAGVSSAAQTSGISAVTLVTEADAAMASLSFAADQAAFAEVADTVITNSVVTQGQVLKLATDGTGDGAAACHVTILVEVR